MHGRGEVANGKFPQSAKLRWGIGRGVKGGAFRVNIRAPPIDSKNTVRGGSEHSFLGDVMKRENAFFGAATGIYRKIMAGLMKACSELSWELTRPGFVPERVVGNLTVPVA